MLKISKKEEKEILQDLFEVGDYIGNGSSRIVFSTGNGRVVKVAFDEKGKRQNEVEVWMSLNFGDRYLARIYGYGEYIIIQEELEVQADFQYVMDEFEFYHDPEKDGSEVFGYTREMIQEGLEVGEFLDQELGISSDNLQLGVRWETDEVVSFDYGLRAGEYNESVSDDFDYVLQEYADGIYRNMLNYVNELILV